MVNSQCTILYNDMCVAAVHKSRELRVSFSPFILKLIYDYDLTCKPVCLIG